MLPLLSIGGIILLFVVACGRSEPTQLATPTFTPGATSESKPVPTQSAPTPKTTPESPQATLAPAPTPTPGPTATKSDREDQFSHLEIVSVLAQDEIQAILNPRFMTKEEARNEYGEAELVLGLSINGDHRAYSITHLSGREIVNDVVGGVPVAVTW